MAWFQIMCGLEFDSTDLSIAPARDKRLKCIRGLIIIVITGKLGFKASDSLMGTITWIASTCYPFCAYTRRIRQPVVQHRRLYGEKEGILEYSSEHIRDARMLLDWLRDIRRVSMLEICNLIPMRRIIIYTDGATNGARPNWCPGIGAYCEGSWFMDKVPNIWRDEYIRYISENKDLIFTKDTDIAHFEALAVVTALNTFKDKINPNTIIEMRCDN